MYQPPQTDDDDQIIFLGAIYDEMDQGENEPADSDLHSMPDDEPSIIKEALQQSLPKFDQWIQEALKSTVPDLLSKPVQRPPMLDNFGKSKAKAVKEAKAKATEDAKANTEGGLSQLTPQVLKNLRLRLRMSNHLKHLSQKLAEYEAKRKRMLERYNHYITFRADKLPITKISYKINNATKDATMRIERNKQPLSLTFYEKFVLKKLGFSEWIEIHALASKVKSKSNDLLLKNLKAKFEWIKTQAEKLGIPPPSELTPLVFPS
ncbi:hypothetical protein Tco_0670471 [Tanacetum coccineum]